MRVQCTLHVNIMDIFFFSSFSDHNCNLFIKDRAAVYTPTKESKNRIKNAISTRHNFLRKQKSVTAFPKSLKTVFGKNFLNNFTFYII